MTPVPKASGHRWMALMLALVVAVGAAIVPTATSAAPGDSTTTSTTEPPAGEPPSTTEAAPATSAPPSTVADETVAGTTTTTTAPDDARHEAAAAEPDGEVSVTALAAGPPEYEITGEWVNPPPSMSRGNPVVAEWRVNVNDSGEPPSNDPVDNVTVHFTLGKAFFDDIPDLCRTTGVEPPSSISEDGLTLTCNLGTVNMGTAVVVQTPVVANGITGEEITHDGSIDGQTVVLPPIPIINPFVMDMQWTGVTQYEKWDDPYNPTYVDVDLQWSLRLGLGSDPGPDTVTYRLNVAAQDGSPVVIGSHPPDIGNEEYRGDAGCTGFDLAQASGHPWSRLDIPATDPRNGSFVDSCVLTQVSPGVFDLRLEGIDYDLLSAPTNDSYNNPLPPDWNYVATGTLWFRVQTDASGSIRLTSNAPTYTANTPIRQTFTDLAGNNTSNKAYTLPGSFAAVWYRPFTRSGGTNWDDTYRLPTGSTPMQLVNSVFAGDNVPAASPYGQCLVFDTAFVRYVAPPENAPFAQIRRLLHGGGEGNGDPLTNPPALEYHTGGVGNPNAFDCFASGGWSTTPPADLAAVTALRIRYPHSLHASEEADGFQLNAYTQIRDDAPIGQDIWMFGSALRNGVTLGPGQPWDSHVITPTDDARYPATNGRRDILRVVLATPNIRKVAGQATVTPGVPADFTLRYSATGTGTVPPTVDDYRIVDTLPAGMTYEPGSADPPPAVTTNGAGQQVLTWNLDGVATNVWHTLTYRAEADSSIPPGTQLTNTAVSSLAGESSAPATATVTTSTNGYTIILKTPDVDYIPNDAGDGVGTGSWTVMVESFDPLPQPYTDTIDILPYIGDQRGTSYSGTYALYDVLFPDGGTAYYATADPTTLEDDPCHPSNGTCPPDGTPVPNPAIWSTTAPDDLSEVTAIRVIGGVLPPGESFSFQVVITTDGAQPQDVYVNRAEGRAGHTELLMRTSAPLVVTDYVVEKSSDPPSGSTVEPGDVVTYTVLVTQRGPVPAGGLFTDTLTEVFDDAVYNEDVVANFGTATIDGDVLSWSGDIPVGEVATITYSVTVKEIPDLEAEGDTFLRNVVWSPGGCMTPVEGCTTEHFVGWYDYSKTSEAEPGSTVQVDDVITYTVEITQRGEGAIDDAIVTDDLTAVLDDATWDNEVRASSGETSLADSTLTWTGDLDVDDVVVLTYSVTVHDDGDFELENVVTSPDTTRSRCVPAPDENPDCRTTHQLGDYQVMKVSDPADESAVEVGDVVTYTVTVTHIGIADVPDAWFDDDLSEVLDDATFNDDADASAGRTSYDEPTLRWTGVLEPGDEVEVTYSVTVTAEGDRHLVNVVTPGGQCVRAEGQDEACTTEHFNGAFVFSKTSNPAPGTPVRRGQVVTYTVTVEHVGTAPVEDASVEDDMTGVLDDATYNGDARASSGELAYANTTLAWTGDLAVDQVVTLTYSVTVRDADASLRNVVTTDDERGLCGSAGAAFGSTECAVSHAAAVAPPAAGRSPVTSRPIPVTG